MSLTFYIVVSSSLFVFFIAKKMFLLYHLVQSTIPNNRKKAGKKEKRMHEYNFKFSTTLNYGKQIHNLIIKIFIKYHAQDFLT